MSQYYYTVASLPYISLEDSMPFSLEDFSRLCEEQLSKKDFETLKNAVIVPGTGKIGNSILKKWTNWETSLRNELAVQRGKAKHVESEDYLHPLESEIFEVKEVVRGALSIESPLEAEDYLDKARWRFLDDLEVDHYFDFEKLLIYSLKLQLLNRRSLFTREKGTANYTRIYDEILNNTKNQEETE